MRWTEQKTLKWPSEVGRTPLKERKQSLFDSRLSVGDAIHEMHEELRLLKATSGILTYNGGLKIVNFIKGRTTDDQGVALWFKFEGAKDKVFCCDKYLKVQHNMRAISKTIGAFRGIERWGVNEIMDRIFTGFEALPGNELWYHILGVKEEVKWEEVVENYKRLAKEHHPDRGGDEERMSKLNKAYDEAKIIYGKKG